jgi:gluconate 2-dehydrogenase subunit 3-like protein
MAEMDAKLLELDDTYVMNVVSKFVSRDPGPARHDYAGEYQANDLRGLVCESWRFPIVDAVHLPDLPDNGIRHNRVTFVWPDGAGSEPDISLIGTFTDLYAPIPLTRINWSGTPMPYQAVSFAVPKAQVHRYLFLGPKGPALDPINPQRITLDDATTWSRFFTELCTQPVTLERRELLLLERLTDHILPFRTADGERFLQYFYNNLDQNTKEVQFASAWRLDQPVGVVNLIDKLLARYENHHLVDYKLCLAQIDSIISRRNPSRDLESISKEEFIKLYTEMASGKVDGWDYKVYQSPDYFLKLLRRHSYTGAFSHPRHGGNVGGAGWAYIEESYRDAAGASCFNWREAIEQPLGTSSSYLG